MTFAQFTEIKRKFLQFSCGILVAGVFVGLAGCDRPVNAPRSLEDYGRNVIYSSFSGRSPKTLDPQVSYSSDESLYTYEVYEPLYQYHYLKRPYEIIPRTAKTVAEPFYVDRDGRRLAQNASAADIAQSVYRIEIQKGILFAPHPAFAKDAKGNSLYLALPAEQAGKLKTPLELPEKGTRELTAEDYIYGFKRIADPRVVSPILGLMQQYVVGLKELSEKLKNRPVSPDAWRDLRGENIAGVRSLDRYTLEIRIYGKYPQFSNWLTMTFFAPVAWEADCFYANPAFRENNISLATWPVGTGAFMLTKSKTNREHVLSRNPNYRFVPYPCEGDESDRKAGLLAACGKPLPFVDKIVMTLEKEAVPTTTKFLSGYYDSPQITRNDVGQGYIVAAQDSEQKASLYRERRLMFPTSTEANIWYLGFNWLDPVVGEGRTPEQKRRNRALRQALSIAVDWEEQIAIFEKGQGSAAHGPLPPQLFGFDPDGASAMNEVVYRRDKAGLVQRRPIEEAKKLLAEAGYPNGRDAKTGKPLVLYFDWQGTAPGSRAFLDWFARQFEKLGVQLEVRASDYNRFQDKMNKGSAQIYYWGWLADYPDAENFLMLLYGPNSKVGSVSGGENASNYRNAEYDRLFEKLKNLENGPEKKAVIDRMIRIVQQDAPWSFGYFPTSAAALHHWVKNAKPTAVIRNNIEYMAIDAGERMESIRQWNSPIWWPLILIALAASGFAAAVFLRAKRARTRSAVHGREGS